METKEFEMLMKVYDEVSDTKIKVGNLETTIRDYNGLRDKLDKTCHMAVANKGSIDRIITNKKAIKAVIITGISSCIVGIILIGIQILVEVFK